MIQDQQAKIQQAINLLNEAMGKNTEASHTAQQLYHNVQSVQANPQGAGFSQFEKQFNTFEAKGKEIGGQIGQLTHAASNMFRLSLNYVNYAKNSKKPDDLTSKKIQELLKSKATPILNLENDNTWRDHAKSVKEMINASFWVFSPSPEFTFVGAIEASEFQANKFRVQKVQAVNDWYNLLLASIKTLQKQVKEHYPTGVQYNFNGTGTWDGLLSGTALPPTETTPQSKAPSKPQQKAIVPPAKKAPVKDNKMGNWFIQNYEGETFDFTAEEAQMKSTFFIQNCSKCVFKIQKSKIKSVVVSRSENIQLIVKDCISGVEIMNSKSVNLRILGVSPSVSIDKSEKIYIVLNGQNKNTDILSSKVSQLNISYTINESDDIAKDHTVPEQISTKWNEAKGKFESVVYDKFM